MPKIIYVVIPATILAIITIFLFTASPAVVFGERYHLDETGLLFEVNQTNVFYNFSDYEGGIIKNLQIDDTNYHILKPGYYSLIYVTNMKSATFGTYEVAVFINDVKVDKSQTLLEFTSANQIKTTTNENIIQLSQGDKINLRISDHDTPVADLTIYEISFLLTRLDMP